ncbi:putative enoyl-CoA hydratase echA6 [Corynebacterium urogenitale]|uniref:Putative enoyl-CoA hydratase echA6 n=2 Tax=Corynebacterium urogenitale TaxID=2487892 RepID=A0A5J6Z987_9CORY|nr:putative enoyl-CoA hydratase echA6 [Corynebacterium urogenitale]
MVVWGRIRWNSTWGRRRTAKLVSMSVLSARHGDVTVITLNNPAKRNALTAQFAREIAEAIREASAGEVAEDRQARAILLRGEGPAFCAGADLGGGVYGDDFWASITDMLNAITESPVPVIADVQGPAVGAGCQLILACDLRVFGERGVCWIPVAKHAFAMDDWTIRRARELLGGSVARNLLLGGAQVGTEQALALGFAMSKASVADQRDEPLEIAQSIAGGAPLSMEHSKRVLNHEDPANDAELQQMFTDVWASEDASEARRARAEQRAPHFTGR